MLAHERTRRPPAAVADALRLPFASGTFDVLVAAFVLNHLLEPEAALTQAARVTRPGGVVLAATFSSRNDHPVKQVVNDVLGARGWVPPDWYLRVKREAEPRTATPGALAGAAEQAGLTAVRVAEVSVEVGFGQPAELVAWRLEMPAYSWFVDALPDGDRTAVVAEVLAALGPRPAPYRPVVLLLSSRVAA
jgi:SAM-dependent methyltransferase